MFFKLLQFMKNRGPTFWHYLSVSYNLFSKAEIRQSSSSSLDLHGLSCPLRFCVYLWTAQNSAIFWQFSTHYRCDKGGRANIYIRKYLYQLEISCCGSTFFKCFLSISSNFQQVWLFPGIIPRELKNNKRPKCIFIINLLIK